MMMMITKSYKIVVVVVKAVQKKKIYFLFFGPYFIFVSFSFWIVKFLFLQKKTTQQTYMIIRNVFLY